MTEPEPERPGSVFSLTFVEKGEITRTTTGIRVRTPRVELEEIGGHGGYFEDSRAVVSYYAMAGGWHPNEVYRLGIPPVGPSRYQAREKRSVATVFDLPINPSPDGLAQVNWDIWFLDDTGVRTYIRIPLLADWLDGDANL